MVKLHFKIPLQRERPVKIRQLPGRTTRHSLSVFINSIAPLASRYFLDIVRVFFERHDIISYREYSNTIATYSIDTRATRIFKKKKKNELKNTFWHTFSSRIYV